MIISLSRARRNPQRATGSKPPRRRDDSGLTTLEWLLIVAAVAGLAALAVVLVQNVVSDTSEQIAGSSARKTAAQVAAAEVTDKARATTASADDPLVADLNAEYKSDCKRLGITYGDVKDIKVVWSQDITATDPVEGNVTDLAVWNGATPTFGCIVP